MDFLLSKYNKEKRNGKRIISSDYIIRRRGGLLHVCLNSSGCRYRNSGSCTMCDYGEGVQLTEKKIENILPHIKKAADGMKSILIGTLGSVLDPKEISLECLEKICNTLNEISVKTVIFETHYTLIDETICCWLKKRLPGKDIVIEVGLESVDEYVQEKCLNKKIDLTILKSKIHLMHKYDISVTANVFLGAPFLSVNEQIQDAEKAIIWAINNSIDSVVVFPANIRANTLLAFLYSSGKYQPIQHWAIFELLCRVPQHYLDRIYLAWYGDWIDINKYKKQENLPPQSCERCTKKWMGFYHQFLEENTVINRQRLLEVYRGKMSVGCGCRMKFEKSLRENVEEKRENRIERNRDWLAGMYYYTRDKEVLK